MKLRGPHFWIATLSLTAVVVVAAVDMRRTSPGPLTSVHEREKDLRGKSGCNDCHGGWFSSMTKSCLECHALVQQQIEESKGLHGVLGSEKAEQCATCHGEHHGASFAIVNRQSFLLAGSKNPEKFDHEMIGFEMSGRHLELDCAQCHANARAVVLEKGTTRYIGLDQNCATCHDDPHEGRMVFDCASCHGQAAWDELHSADHDRFLPLIGGHADIGCRECHASSGTHALEVLGTVRPQPRQCAECHDSPHDETFVTGVAGSAAMAVEASCVTCHEAEHTTFRDEHLELSVEQHAHSGFALAAPHDEVECAECHAPERESFAERYPGRGADECSACHEDAHDGQFEDGPFAGGDCIACHDRQHFEPHAFTVEKHQLASLPLSGAHIQTECNACHEVAREGEPRIFRGTASVCDACHQDAHRGFFDPFTIKLPEEKFGDCARCHGTASFASAGDAGFDHDRWTGFAVAGAHSESGCTSCHPLAGEADESGRKFGWVEEEFGEYQGCVTCHADVHDGLFDAADLPASIDGKQDCARCHVDSSFRAVAQDFDHGRWTGFAVVGAHAEIGCSGCHASLRSPDELGRTWARANGPLCSDCHEDPHAGQFEVQGETDCQRCHVDDVEDYLDFDHDRDSRFVLGSQHEDLECAACHLPALFGDVEFVRYRPLGRECFDCHGVHEEVLLRKMPKRR